MTRPIDKTQWLQPPILTKLGLSTEVLQNAVTYAYTTLDLIDTALTKNDGPKMAELLELANLSAVLGNLVRAGVAKASDGRFVANGPHKYPDLLSLDPRFGDLEIKVALEENKPKGHLVKPGPHLIVRYVLGSDSGDYTSGKDRRGNTIWIWELRLGVLEEAHFNVSNTAGDSGKTAVINARGLNELSVVFADLKKYPGKHSGANYRTASRLFEQD